VLSPRKRLPVQAKALIRLVGDKSFML
jgi:hypothetical protein